MTDGHENAFPDDRENGLSKREYFAALAMQGFVTHAYTEKMNAKLLAEISVKQADALIAALNADAGKEST